jgi:hypothetical protein
VSVHGLARNQLLEMRQRPVHPLALTLQIVAAVGR